MLNELKQFCDELDSFVKEIEVTLPILEDERSLGEEDRNLREEIQPRLRAALDDLTPALEGAWSACKIVRDTAEKEEGTDGRNMRQQLAHCQEVLERHRARLCDDAMMSNIMQADGKPRYHLTEFKAQLVHQLARVSIHYTRAEGTLARCWEEVARSFRLTSGWEQSTTSKELDEVKRDFKNIVDGVTNPDAPIPSEVRQGSHKVSDAVDGLGQHVEGVGESIASFIGDESVDPSLGVGGSLPGGVLDLERQVDIGLGAILGAPLTVPATEEPDTRFAGRVTRLLDRGIERKEKQGRVTFVRRNPSLSVATHEDGQRLGGAQAALSSWLSSEVEMIKKLVGQLKPTLLEVDEDTVDYLKDDLGRRLDALTVEVGREGGPIPERVGTLINAATDDLSNLAKRLVGERARNLSSVHFRDLPLAEGERTEELIQVIEESLKNAHKTIADRIGGPTDELPRSRGAKLALLARTVEALPASVQQAYRALDSAGLGESDRRAFREIGNLLEWIRTSAERDWAVRLRDGDAREIEIKVLHDEAQMLVKEVDGLKPSSSEKSSALWETSTVQYSNRDRGLGALVPYGSRRVERALRELRRLLQRSVDLADSVIKGANGS